jgi:valyl-tRNA synthetase
MKELPKKYNASEIEAKWQKYWAENNIYKWDESASREDNFVIDTPPPTVSGHLHIGHIFSYTHTDYVARYQRMKGKNVFYPMGFDDNGLPTERLVEKNKKTKAHKHSREEFIEMCLEVSESARRDFRDLFTSTALSVDWSQEYNTVSPEVMKISQMSFLDLYEKNEVYRKLQPMFWDPIDQTAIAQAEVEEKELDSFENYIYFGIIDKGADPKSVNWEDLKKEEIMTTRPELLAACVALMVHPDDAHKFEGKMAVTPLFGAIVPIIADEKVDKEKGTGFVMCCTFGDETDVEWWKKHNLDTRVILNKFGKVADWISDRVILFEEPLDWENCLNIDNAIDYYSQIAGKKADHQEENLSAKKIMIRLLEENGFTAKEKEPIKHMVKCAERSGAALELIPTQQWFVNILGDEKSGRKNHKEELKKKVDECNWKPAFMAKRAHQWIDSLSWDWCISRQRYFGVPFPVWYVQELGASNQELEVVVAEKDELPVNPIVDIPKGYEKKQQNENGSIIAIKDGKEYYITPDFDVMDTWATSSVSPQINSHAITEKFAINADRHAKLYHADLRPQAHEIIRTWAFYTILKSHLHQNSIPWKNLMISGWCLAEDKTKMSKSKGNVVTPGEIMKQNSADVVRYWSSTSKLGADTAFSPDVLKVGKKLTTKLWNATKFAALHLGLLKDIPSSAKQAIEQGKITETSDKWIISELHKTIKKATKSFEDYEYSAARHATEEFFWNFCDNYLEIAKKRTYDEAEENIAPRESALLTIYYCLDAVLRLFAPILPHITEELYSHIFEDKFNEIKSIHARGNWVNLDDYYFAEESVKAGNLLVDVLDEVRKYKAEKAVSIKFPIKELEISCNENAQKLIKSAEYDLLNVTSTEEITFQNSDSEEIKVNITLGEKENAA